METALMCNVFNVCMDDLGKMKFYQMFACRCLRMYVYILDSRYIYIYITPSSITSIGMEARKLSLMMWVLTQMPREKNKHFQFSVVSHS